MQQSRLTGGGASLLTCSQYSDAVITLTSSSFSFATFDQISIRLRNGSSPSQNGTAVNIGNFTATGSGVTNLSMTITIKNSSVILHDNNNNVSDQTTSITRHEGSFFIDGVFTPFDPNGSQFTYFTNPLLITLGSAPNFTINSKTEDKIVLLNGCDPTIKIKVNNTSNCATDNFLFSIWEVNPKVSNSTGGFATIGSEYFRNLTSTELAAIISTNGMSLTNNQFSDVNSNTITIQPNHTYSIKLAYNGQGVFKAITKTLQYKNGSYDLIMKDFATDNGFEPSVHPWSTQDVFHSPDIWNKLSTSITPNTTASENPDFVTNAANSNKMMVKVKNIGCATSNATPLKMFWTLARTDEVWKHDWSYDLTNNGVNGAVTSSLRFPLGSETTIGGSYPPTYTDPWGTDNRNNSSNSSSPFIIPAINAGAEYSIPFNSAVNWFPPDPAEYSTSNGSGQKFQNADRKSVV